MIGFESLRDISEEDEVCEISWHCTIETEPYAFPAAVPLVLSNPISQCLVSGQRWDVPAVNYHLDILFWRRC